MQSSLSPQTLPCNVPSHSATSNSSFNFTIKTLNVRALQMIRAVSPNSLSGTKSLSHRGNGTRRKQMVSLTLAPDSKSAKTMSSLSLKHEQWARACMCEEALKRLTAWWHAPCVQLPADTKGKSIKVKTLIPYLTIQNMILQLVLPLLFLFEVTDWWFHPVGNCPKTLHYNL